MGLTYGGCRVVGVGFFWTGEGTRMVREGTTGDGGVLQVDLGRREKKGVLPG